MDQHHLIQQTKILKELGLYGNEARVYLTLLSLGTNPVSTIANKAGLNRCTCYAVIERLIQKGFIGQIIKDNIAYFSAAEPINVLNHLKTKHYELEKKINILGKSIANMQRIKEDHPKRPRVVFFEGTAGLRNIMEDSLSSNEELRAYASLNELYSLLPDYFPNYYLRRTKKKIAVRAIYPANETSYLHKLRDRQELRQSRLIPKEFDFHLDILIYDNKVAITSLQAKFGVLIENREMYEAQKKIFDFIWNATEIFDSIMTKIIGEQMAQKKAPCNHMKPF